MASLVDANLLLFGFSVGAAVLALAEYRSIESLKAKRERLEKDMQMMVHQTLEEASHEGMILEQVRDYSR